MFSMAFILTFIYPRAFRFLPDCNMHPQLYSFYGYTILLPYKDSLCFVWAFSMFLILFLFVCFFFLFLLFIFGYYSYGAMRLCVPVFLWISIFSFLECVHGWDQWLMVTVLYLSEFTVFQSVWGYFTFLLPSFFKCSNIFLSAHIFF